MTGGEPFIRKDLIRIIDIFYNELNDANICILTNGTLLDRDKIKQLSKYKDRLTMMISLDGSTPKVNDRIRGKGVFNKVIKVLDLLNERDFSLIIGYTICKINKDDIFPFINVMKKKGINKIHLSFIQIEGRAKINKNILYLNIDEFKKIIDKLFILQLNNTHEIELDFCYSFIKTLLNPPTVINCGAGVRTLHIKSNGEVYPCVNLMDKNFLMVKDIRKINDFSDISRTEIYKLFSNLTVDSIEKCNTCIWKKICVGGCRGIAYKHYKSIYKPDPFCTIIKDIYEKYFCKILLKNINFD